MSSNILSNYKKHLSRLVEKRYKDKYIDFVHERLCKDLDDYFQLRKSVDYKEERIEINKNITLRVYYNEYNKRFLLPFFVFSESNPVNQRWIKDQVDYVDNLSEYDKDLVNDWTGVGYHDLKTDDEFGMLFDRAPLSDTPIYLYRNEKTASKTFMESDVGQYKMKDCHSAYTLSYNFAINWEGNHIFRVKVLPNVPLLLIATQSRIAEEFEVLLPKGFIYYVNSVNKEARVPMFDEHSSQHSICPSEVKRFKKVYFTDLTVVGFYNPSIQNHSIEISRIPKLSNNISRKLLATLERIRKKKVEHDIYIDDNHRAVCEKYERIMKSLDRFSFEKKLYKIQQLTIKDNKRAIENRFVEILYNTYNRYFINNMLSFQRFIPYDVKFFITNAQFLKGLSDSEFKNTILEYIKTADPLTLRDIYDKVPRTTQDMLFFGTDMFFPHNMVKEGDIIENSEIVSVDIIFDPKMADAIKYRVLVPKNTPLVCFNNKAHIDINTQFLVKRMNQTIEVYDNELLKYLKIADTPYRFLHEQNEHKNEKIRSMICPNEHETNRINVVDVVVV